VRRIVTLLTDFGTSDGYVGQMKGAILQRSGDCQLVDITHEIPPQNVGLAARALGSSWKHFPVGTVHLAVVDPGVGTDRDILAATVAGHFFVAPNNGLLSAIIEARPADEADRRIISVDVDRFFDSPTSNTFHGRDIMGPVAGMLAAGVPIAQLGEPFTGQLIELPSLVVGVDAEGVRTEVAAIDHFGNCSLATTFEFESWFATKRRVRAQLPSSTESVYLEVCRTYGQQPAGANVLLTGSQGEIEIAVVNGNAAEKFQLSVGDSVTLA